MGPSEKAAFACGAFMLAGALGWWYAGDTGQFPLLIYYAVLVLNTFFSVRLFSALTPHNALQNLLDGLLALSYIALVLSFSSVLYFAAASLALFVLAVVKYVHLSRLIAPLPLLQRKIRINTLGGALSLAALVAAAAGYGPTAAYGLALTFALANVYLLLINPMYRMSQA